MRTTESVVVAAPAAAVYPFVADLAAYPRWLPLVHEALTSPAEEGAIPAWEVEIRARVGPFARSKRLRMARIESIDDRLVVFERAEVDGREHARWALRVELVETPDTPGATPTDEPSTDQPPKYQTSTVVTMHLAYDGRLWTAGILERVLDEEVRRGRSGLVALVSAHSTH